MTTDVTDQAAATPLTDPSSPPEGYEVPVIEQPEADAVSNEEAKQARIEQKKSDISQSEWQNMKEKTKVLDKLVEVLGVDPKGVKKPEDLTQKLQSQVSNLQEEINRAKWEKTHPIVDSEKYQEAWTKVNADPRYSNLNYDERWKLIKDEPPSKAQGEFKNQQMNVGSVPVASKSAPTGGDHSQTLGFLREMYPQYAHLSDEKLLKLSE